MANISQLPSIFLLSLLFILPATILAAQTECRYNYKERTIAQVQNDFKKVPGVLTPRHLVVCYLENYDRNNKLLKAIVEANPDAKNLADAFAKQSRPFSKPLSGIPILLKDNIGTTDKLNTTSCSYALLGSKVKREADVVTRLRAAGAIILGKASLSEWDHFRTRKAPNGWCPRLGGKAVNPYVPTADPCGSSSGSAIGVAANMAMAALGTETARLSSILCPAEANSVVGIKPTFGLTRQDGIIPSSSKQDTVGPIARTVEDAVRVLDVIVDKSVKGSGGDYIQSLKLDGLNGTIIGVISRPFFKLKQGSLEYKYFVSHQNTLRKKGARLIDINFPELTNIYNSSYQETALLSEFKTDLEKFLRDQVLGTVNKSLRKIIEFNNKESKENNMYYGQDLFVEAEGSHGDAKGARMQLEKMSLAFERKLKESKAHAFVTVGSDISTILDIGGYPGIIVPAGFDDSGKPFGICFSGAKMSERTLIKIAYNFENATNMRRAPKID